MRYLHNHIMIPLLCAYIISGQIEYVHIIYTTFRVSLKRRRLTGIDIIITLGPSPVYDKNPYTNKAVSSSEKRSCCALLCFINISVPSAFIEMIYPYSSALLLWHCGHRIDCGQHVLIYAQ